MRPPRTALFAALALIAGPALARSPLDGNWTNPKRSVTVRIAACGPVLCGRVVSANAKAKADAAAAGTTSLVGTELMSGLEPTGRNSWHGSVFVPDPGITSDADLELIAPGRLLVRGCALGGLMCREQVWTRVGSAASRAAR